MLLDLELETWQKYKNRFQFCKISPHSKKFLQIFTLTYEALKYDEEVAQRCSVKKVFLEISQNSPLPESLVE